MNIFKTLIIFLLLGATLPAGAQDELPDHVKKDMQLNLFAEDYQKSCNDDGHNYMNERELEGFCACAAQNIKNKISYDNILSIYNGGEDAQYQNNRITFEVYMPCMAPPVSQIVYKDCAFNPEMGEMLDNHREDCTCIANTIQSYVSRVSPMDMISILQTSSKDPMSALVESQQFNIAMKDAFESCN